MNNSTKLRDYQLSMLQDLYKAWKRHRSVMVQMPTGTGKTHLMAAAIRDHTDGGVLVVAHRRELIGQISQTLERFGIAHGLIVSGKEVDLSQKVQVASIQTLARRLGHTDRTDSSLNTNGHELTINPVLSLNTNDHKLTTNFSGRDKGKAVANSSFFTLHSSFNKALHFSLIIVDEAHHALAETYRMLWETWPKAKFLGLTATPCRLSAEPFTDLFQTLLQSWSIQEFIDRGWLSDFEYVSASPDSGALRRVRLLKKRGVDGDYQQKELATVMDVPESIAHLYKTYRQFAGGKKGIVYAIDREHARHIAEYYQQQGVRCAVIDSKTPAEERKRIIEEYKETHPQPLPAGRGVVTSSTEKSADNFTDNSADSTIYSPPCREGQGVGLQGSVLINVDVFSEGFDCPEVEFIQLARPTLSLSKYLQQVGRGMRVSPGKPHVLILDNVGLYQTFGLPTEERDWRQTFYGLANGKGDADENRYVVLDDSGIANPLERVSERVEREKELVNLQMVRIKKGGKRGVGLEIFIKDGRYGVRNNGHVSCPARFKEIVRLNDESGYFAAGIYSGKDYDDYVEYASLIDRRGVDLKLRLFRDVMWKDGYFYSSYKRPDYKEDDYFWSVYWDPKGNCYYDFDPSFRMLAGVEVARASEHHSREKSCLKLRYTTGGVSPRFSQKDMYYNRQVIVARDYLIVKKDHNHAYHICAFLSDSVLVRQESGYGYQRIFMDGRKGECFRSIPPDAKCSILQVQLLGLKRI